MPCPRAYDAEPTRALNALLRVMGSSLNGLVVALSDDTGNRVSTAVRLQVVSPARTIPAYRNSPS